MYVFIQKQEEFNQRLEQRIEENINQSQKGREKKSRRLPKALTVSLTLLLFSPFFGFYLLLSFFAHTWNSKNPRINEKR